MKSRQKSVFFKVLIICGVIALCTFFRLYSLESDPPDYLSWSAAVYIDEGYKALDARNTHLYGSNRWSPYDTYAGHVASSILMYNIQVRIFEHFGLSVKYLRYVNIGISLGIIFILLVTIAFIFDAVTVLLMGAALSFNVILLFHSRLALYELPMVLIGFLPVPFFFIFFKKRGFKKKFYGVLYFIFLLFIVGIVSNLGLLVKGSFPIYMGSIIVAFGFSALLPVYKKSDRIPPLFELKNLYRITLGGIVFLYAVLYIFGMSRYTQKPGMLVAKVWFLEFIYLQPITMLLAVLCSIAVLKILYRKKYSSYGSEKLFEYQIDLFFVLQFIISFLMVYLSSYSPLRYFLFSQISIIYLASRFVSNYDNEIKILRIHDQDKLRSFKPYLRFLVLFFLVIQLIIFLMMLFLGYESRNLLFDSFYFNLVKRNFFHPSVYYVVILILLIIPVVIFLTVNYDDLVKFIRKHMNRKIMVFLLIEIQLVYLLSWQFNKTDKIYQCMNFVKTLPENSIIIGDWAPMLAFESDLRVIYSNPGDRRNMGNINQIKPDYVVVKSNKNEERRYNRHVPGLIKPENEIYNFKVQAFEIKIYQVDLYRKVQRW